MILKIIRLYTEAGCTDWDRLEYDIHRFLINIVPINCSLTEQYEYIAKHLKMEPYILEKMLSEVNSSECFVCMKILKSLDIGYLDKCQKFLIANC
jgi:hypothetical protein